MTALFVTIQKHLEPGAWTVVWLRNPWKLVQKSKAAPISELWQMPQLTSSVPRLLKHPTPSIRRSWIMACCPTWWRGPVLPLGGFSKNQHRFRCCQCMEDYGTSVGKFQILRSSEFLRFQPSKKPQLWSPLSWVESRWVTAISGYVESQLQPKPRTPRSPRTAKKPGWRSGVDPV